MASCLKIAAPLLATWLMLTFHLPNAAGDGQSVYGDIILLLQDSALLLNKNIRNLTGKLELVENMAVKANSGIGTVYSPSVF